jgi:5-methylcytosine-specific restriction enzyme A
MQLSSAPLALSRPTVAPFGAVDDTSHRAPPHPCARCRRELVAASVRFCAACAAAQPPVVNRAEERRGSSRDRGYTSRWDRFRRVYLRKHPLCRACEARDRVTAATLVDHVVPHRGDRARFWDEANLQPLCEACHGAKTAAEVRVLGGASMDPRALPGRAAVPLFVLCGPPASGRSTRARALARAGDVVIDPEGFDSETTSPASEPAVLHCLAQAAALAQPGRGRALLVTDAPQLAERRRWREYGAVAVTVLEVPPDECARRIARDTRRQDPAAREALAARWWTQYVRSPDDVVLPGRLEEMWQRDSH